MLFEAAFASRMVPVIIIANQDADAHLMFPDVLKIFEKAMLYPEVSILHPSHEYKGFLEKSASLIADVYSYRLA